MARENKADDFILEAISINGSATFSCAGLEASECLIVRALVLHRNIHKCTYRITSLKSRVDKIKCRTMQVEHGLPGS